MGFVIEKIDHVQVTAPEGCEEQARQFYNGLLKMKEVEKPEPLKSRGGVWFEFGNFQLHVGVEKSFSAAQKAHPAFVVKGFDELRTYLMKSGVDIEDDTSIPGSTRFFMADPFGNRLEFLKEGLSGN